MPLNVRVTTPIGTVWEGIARSVILPSTDGELGVLQGHVPLTAFLDVGVMRIQTGNSWIPIFLTGGFAQIEGDEVEILVNEAQRGDRIDLQLAKDALEASEHRLSQAQSRAEKWMAAEALKHARARLKAAQGSVP